MATIFVDGSEGTTGLRIHEYLAQRTDLELIPIDPARRKDPEARAECLNQADYAILCLPDDAARESVGLLKDSRTRILDASTAHRTHPEWAYGIPELCEGQRERITTAARVAIGGCHATAFLLALRPLLDAGLVPADYPITAQSLTGYSGGGKKMIARFEATAGDQLAICPYALGLQHKHLPEMQVQSGLAHPPLFLPAVGRFYQGLTITLPFVTRLTEGATPERVHALLSERYSGERAVRVMQLETEAWLSEGLLEPTGCNGTNRVDLFVVGHAEQTAILARLDNLGKGAAGAAVQCLNLMLETDEFEGLRLD